MAPTYYEQLALSEAREADRQLLFAALRTRRATFRPRNVLATLFWLLGVTR